jgi:hypothetical protein
MNEYLAQPQQQKENRFENVDASLKIWTIPNTRLLEPVSD